MNMIFINHANPENNQFAFWLSTKLASSGYPVWCDLIDLVGGETFWDDIECAIRDHSVKFIAIISQASGKQGVKDEINCAIQRERSQNLTDFVIPCRIDDTPFEQINIQLARKNVVDCRIWADGLAKIIEKLEKDGVAKSQTVNASLVGSAWQALHKNTLGLSDEQEPYDTNRFEILKLPETIWANDYDAPEPGESFPATASMFNGRRLSFEPRFPKAQLFNRDPEFARPLSRSIEEFLGIGWNELEITPERAHFAVIELLSKSWNRYLRVRSLEPYDLSGFRPVFYFHRVNLPGGEVKTQLPGRPARPRSVWGEHTVIRRSERESRYYHLALEGRILHDPSWHLMLLPHIVWTADGHKDTYTKEEQHRLRRRQCKGWWNDRWRGFLYSAMTWARNENDTIVVPVGGNQIMDIAAHPVRLLSPISHKLVAKHPSLEEEGGQDE